MPRLCGGSGSWELGETHVTRQQVTPSLYELAYSPREKLVYVVSSGGRGANAEPSKLFWLDGKSLQIMGELPLQTSGFGMALDADAGRLYLTNTLDGSVTVVDTQSKQVLSKLPLIAEGAGHRFREAVVDPQRHRLYLPGMGSNSALYVVDTKNLVLDRVIPGFGANATGITLNGNGSRVFVSTMTGELYTVDADSLAIISKAEPEGEVLLNLAYDGRRGHILATDRKTEPRDGQSINPHNDDQILVIDGSNGKRLNHLPSDPGTLAVLMDEQRDLLYATNRNGHSVTVYDMGDQKLLRTVDLPTYPNSLALDPDSGAVYVNIKNGRDEIRSAAPRASRASRSLTDLPCLPPQSPASLRPHPKPISFARP